MSTPEAAMAGVGDEFIRVCSVGELEDAVPLALEVADIPLCVVRTHDEVFAIFDECSHAEVPLSEGEVEDCTVECWLHGSRFDLRTGEPTGLPATEPVPVYPVRIDGDDVLVRLKEI